MGSLTRKERESIDNLRLWVIEAGIGAVLGAIVFEMTKGMLFGGIYSLI